jgi:hypothetical protein
VDRPARPGDFVHPQTVPRPIKHASFCQLYVPTQLGFVLLNCAQRRLASFCRTLRPTELRPRFAKLHSADGAWLHFAKLHAANAARLRFANVIDSTAANAAWLRFANSSIHSD